MTPPVSRRVSPRDPPRDFTVSRRVSELKQHLVTGTDACQLLRKHATVVESGLARSSLSEQEKVLLTAELRKGRAECKVFTRNVVIMEIDDVSAATGGERCRTVPVSHTSTVAVARPAAHVNTVHSMLVAVSVRKTKVELEYDEGTRKAWVALHKDYKAALNGALTRLERVSEMSWKPTCLSSACIMPPSISCSFGRVARDFLRVGTLCSATRALQDSLPPIPVHVGFEATVVYRRKAPACMKAPGQSIVTAKTTISASSLRGNLVDRGEDKTANLSLEVSMCGCRLVRKRCPVHTLASKSVSVGSSSFCSALLSCWLVSRRGREIVSGVEVTETLREHPGVEESLASLTGLCSSVLGSASSEGPTADDAGEVVRVVESKLDAAETTRKRQKRACSEASDVAVAELIRQGGFEARKTEHRTTFYSLGTCVPALNPTYALYARARGKRKR